MSTGTNGQFASQGATNRDSDGIGRAVAAGSAVPAAQHGIAIPAFSFYRSIAGHDCVGREPGAGLQRFQEAA